MGRELTDYFLTFRFKKSGFIFTPVYQPDCSSDQQKGTPSYWLLTGAGGKTYFTSSMRAEKKEARKTESMVSPEFSWPEFKPTRTLFNVLWSNLEGKETFITAVGQWWTLTPVVIILIGRYRVITQKSRAGLLSLMLRLSFLQCMDSLSCSTNRDLSFHILEVVQVTNWAHFSQDTHVFLLIPSLKVSRALLCLWRWLGAASGADRGAVQRTTVGPIGRINRRHVVSHLELAKPQLHSRDDTMAGHNVAERNYQKSLWHFTAWMENPGNVRQSCFPRQSFFMFISAWDHCLPRFEPDSSWTSAKWRWDQIYTAG